MLFITFLSQIKNIYLFSPKNIFSQIRLLSTLNEISRILQKFGWVMYLENTDSVFKMSKKSIL